MGREGGLHSGSEPETQGRWGAGIIFSHFTLSELAFGWKNHPQGTLWAATPLITQGHSLLQVPLETRDSRGGTLRASLPDSAAGREGVSLLLGLLQPCNLLTPLSRLGGGSAAQRVCKAAVSPRAQTLHQLGQQTGKPVAGMFTQPRGRPRAESHTQGCEPRLDPGGSHIPKADPPWAGAQEHQGDLTLQVALRRDWAWPEGHQFESPPCHPLPGPV